MPKLPERSPGGSTIHRYTPRNRPLELARGEAPHAAELEAHVERHFGKITSVFHELISDLVHVDVHVIPPTGYRPQWTLFTTGMSGRAMKVPPSANGYELAELMIHLPPDWPVDTTPDAQVQETAESFWPIQVLKFLARFPHEYDTWLGFGHTVPNGDPAEPYAPGTALAGALLLPPLNVPEDARAVKLQDGRKVHLYTVHFLTPEEMSFKLNRGTDALLALFDEHKVSEVLDPKRASTVKRRLFGVF